MIKATRIAPGYYKVPANGATDYDGDVIDYIEVSSFTNSLGGTSWNIIAFYAEDAHGDTKTECWWNTYSTKRDCMASLAEWAAAEAG